MFKIFCCKINNGSHGAVKTSVLTVYAGDNGRVKKSMGGVDVFKRPVILSFYRCIDV